jgi:hypothetical protein
LFSWWRPFWWGEMEYQCCFDFHFHFWLRMLNIYEFISLCASFLENCLWNSFSHLLIGLFGILVFNFLSSLYILDMNHLSDEQIAKIFSHSLSSSSCCCFLWCHFMLLSPKLLESY